MIVAPVYILYLSLQCLVSMDMPKVINFCGGGASISIAEGSVEIFSTV